MINGAQRASLGLLLKPWPLTGQLVGALLFFASSSAWAGPFSTLGFDPESQAYANGNIAEGGSLGSLYTNPALLPDREPLFQFGVLGIEPDLHVHLMPKPPGSDVPLSIYASNIGNIAGVQNRSLPTVELQNARGDTNINGLQAWVGTGASTSLSIEGLRVGVYAALPATGGQAASVTSHYDDEREAAFSDRVSLLRFGQWQEIASVLAGAGYRITRWLTLGASAQLGASAIARLNVYIPNGAVQSYALSNIDAQVGISWRPILGVKLEPESFLSFGLVWRAQSSIKVEGDSVVTLWNYHTSDPTRSILQVTTQSFPLVVDYEPMEVSAGVALRHDWLSGQLSATWQRWSQYLDNHDERPQDVAVPPPSPFPQPVVNPAQFAFHDTLNLQGAIAMQLAPWDQMILGATWRPTPIPPQIGRTNYADSDLLGLTLGQRFQRDVHGHALIVALSLQFWAMMPQTTYKDPSLIIDEFPDQTRTIKEGKPIPEATGLQTNNPGYPGYQVDGVLLSGGVSVSYAF